MFASKKMKRQVKPKKHVKGELIKIETKKHISNGSKSILTQEHNEEGEHLVPKQSIYKERLDTLGLSYGC